MTVLTVRDHVVSALIAATATGRHFQRRSPLGGVRAFGCVAMDQAPYLAIGAICWMEEELDLAQIFPVAGLVERSEG